MPSEVDVVNNALFKLGAEPISDLADDNSRAILARRMLPDVEDAVFRSHRWNCLQKRATLAQLLTAPVWGFAYAYQLPDDCIKVNETSLDEDKLTYRIEGRQLVTDEPDVSILYTARVTDPQQWDTLLRETIAATLAAEMSLTITGSQRTLESMWSLTGGKAQASRSMDAQEGTPGEIRANELIDVRR